VNTLKGPSLNSNSIASECTDLFGLVFLYSLHPRKNAILALMCCPKKNATLVYEQVWYPRKVCYIYL
jgi:hypothetical protein